MGTLFKVMFYDEEHRRLTLVEAIDADDALEFAEDEFGSEYGRISVEAANQGDEELYFAKGGQFVFQTARVTGEE